jgi:hypothetical protein
MYEPHHERPIAGRHFVRRLAGHAGVAGAFVLLSLLIGMAGYAYFEGLEWRQAFLNAAMLLSGEGPIDPPRTPGGKLFAGVYALYSGLVFLATIALVLTPIVHRVLHKFHWGRP